LVGSGHPAGGDGATDGWDAKSRFHRSGPAGQGYLSRGWLRKTGR
jgi:hypothetical protein